VALAIRNDLAMDDLKGKGSVGRLPRIDQVGITLVSRGGKLKNIKLISLNEPGVQISGNYCDPLTGECYPGSEPENIVAIAIDPVCKMEVAVETTAPVTEYQGQRYYFCSDGCQREFEANPARFLADSSHG
jgi:YHS domain-containing protein